MADERFNFPPEALPDDPWPRALPGPVPTGTFRASPEAFRVSEILPFPENGDGMHCLLRIAKRGVNTGDLAKELARRAGVRARDVGFAGRKDREAVAEQYFTIPPLSGSAGALPSDWQQASGEGWQVTGAWATRKKLRPGVLAGNRFALHLETDNPAAVAERVAQAAQRGVPNYFGPQRFGREGANLPKGRELAACGGKGGGERGLWLSALRSYWFNRVLAVRVADGTWDRLLPGELALLDGRRGGFVVDDPAQEAERLASGAIHPSGPLPGGRTDARTPQGEAAALEASVLAQEEPAPAELDMEAERRALRLWPADLAWQAGEGGGWLHLTLGPGSFATAVIRELIQPPA